MCGNNMIPPIPTQATVFALNLVLSLTIVAISIWGYYRIGKSTPLYFGAAYVLFALSHFLIFTGTPGNDPILIPIRIGGYILEAVGLFALLRDIIERQKAETALKESEDHLGATFAQTAVGIVEFLPGGTICRYNRKFTEILRGDTVNWLSESIWNVIAPDDHLAHIGAFNAVIRGDIPEYANEMLVTRKDRSVVWCQVSLSAVKSNDGTPKYFILVMDDISERKHAEEELAALNAGLEQRVVERTLDIAKANDQLISEINQRSLAEEQLKASLHEKEVLIKEIHHRVKNNLQIIVSLLDLQAHETNDQVSKSALIDSQTRVKSMALIHEKLYQSHNLSSIDFEAYLQNLVGNLMIAYNVDRKRIRVAISAQKLPLTINTAIPMGLMMNELISNSLKYAFPDGKTGSLTIHASVEGNTITVKVRDDGVGIPEDFEWKNAKSLGLHLVQMLTRQLRGTVELTREGGTQFAVTIPVKTGAGAP
jgi:PAS domain S-box-containing protein